MTTPASPACTVCGGDLIGGEVDYSTCGHCGGRSRVPDRRRTIATVTTPVEPTADVLDSIEAAYREEGYAKVAAIPSPASTEHGAAGWETRVVAEGNPYERSIVDLDTLGTKVADLVRGAAEALR